MTYKRGKLNFEQEPYMSVGDIIGFSIIGVLGTLLIVCSIALINGRGSFLIAGFNTLPKEQKKKRGNMIKINCANSQGKYYCP